MPGIQPPLKGNVTLEPIPGCHVMPAEYGAWFQETRRHGPRLPG